MKKIFFLVGGIAFILFVVGGSLTVWEGLSISMFIYFFLEFLYDLGKRIVILDMLILLAIATWLVMPVIFYHFYTRENYLARLWFKFMPIPSDEYFSFVLPGTLTMILGLRIPLGKRQINKHPQEYIENVKKQLARRPTIGFVLIAVGVI